MIEGLAISILEKLASDSVDYVFKEIKAAKSAKEDLNIIKEKMEAICAVLKDAENKGYNSERIKIWLRDLKRVLYEIDDLLDEVAYDAKLRKVNKGRFTRKLRYYASSSNPLISRFPLSHKITHLRDKLNNIDAKKNEFDLTKDPIDHPSSKDEIRDPLDRCPFVHKPSTIGRDEAKQDILGEVYGVGDATELSVLPIMGMGGIGKTTLAKLVYDDVQYFDLKLWACVSDKFQIRQIIEDIIKSGKGDVAPNQDLNTLVEKLQDLLKDQKYFLVLDDVWENDVVKWKKLKDLLMIGRAGSVILITTRDPNVASITKTRNLKPYNLQKLPEDVCWSIFKGLAFTDDEDEEARYPRLYEIGESIIKKCCGIPLVVITLGSLLRRERDDKKWQDINEMDSFVQLDQHYEKVIQLLKLSYDKLSFKLKSCFAYLSLFPKDMELHSTDLPYFWNALGLLQVRNDHKNEIEDYGYTYLMDLVSRSLLDKDPYMHIDYCECKMHDFLHDLACKILQEDLSVVTLEKLDVSELTMHIVWGYEEGDQLKDTKFPIELQKAKNARTFRFSYKMHHLSQSFLEGIISHFSCLRILDLGTGWFEKLPESIGKLKHLRFLNLSYNPILRSLPNTICELLNLEYLNFGGCEQLKEIPKDVFQLQSLRYLGVTTCEMSLVDTKLNKLTSLHTLEVESCKRLESLWESGDVGGLTSLRKLNIVDCPKLKCLPNSMKFLVSLQQLTIWNCEELEMEEGEGLQGHQSLRCLQIKGVPKMKNIPDGIQSVAASLEYLYIVNCEGLVQLPEWLQHFASLREIAIIDCPNLLSLPTGFRHLQSMQQLVIEKCPHLSEKCAEYEGEDYPLIKHIPEVELDGVLFKGAKISINE